MAAALLAPDSYYTPERLDYWLRNWTLLEVLAETPGSARHQLSEEHRHYDRGCQTPPRISSGPRQHADELRWADVQADIERAHVALGKATPEFKIVAIRMRYPGESLGVIAKRVRARYQTVRRVYQRAMVLMSQILGGARQG